MEKKYSKSECKNFNQFNSNKKDKEKLKENFYWYKLNFI